MSIEEAKRADHKVKWLVLITSLATLALLFAAYLKENVTSDAHRIRGAFAELLERRATDERGRAIAARFAPGIQQSYLPEIGRVDRCQTCHAGVTDPRLAEEPQPFASHPGRLLEIHPPGKFGCTVCHEGQGRATEVDDAHGRVPFWDHPMLGRAYLTTSCTRCHDEAAVARKGGIIARATGRDGALVQAGAALFVQRGCQGCHLVDGRGGTLGPDLSLEGEKTGHELDFSHLPKDVPRDVRRWHLLHFEDPAGVSPGSQMPAVSPAEAPALTAYMLSRRKKVGAAAYRAPSRAQREPSGRELYLRLCSACHGPEGRRTGLPGIPAPSLANADALAVESDDYLRLIIAGGRSGTAMPAWGQGPNRLSRSEIDRIVAFIRGWEPEAAAIDDISARSGDARRGAAYFRGLCANCHGKRAQGGLGNSLTSPDFLGIATDDFLARSIIEGRPGTAMPSWRGLSSEAISDILAFLRRGEGAPPSFEEVLAAPQDLREGAILYRARCAGCHGASGEGGVGPLLDSQDLLAADDRFLYRAITEGRPGTAMPAWRQLSAGQIAGILAHLRSWQRGSKTALAAPRLRGDPRLGEVLYRDACLGCHGEGAVGGSGPQLANRVLLSSASDDLLYRWIARGRRGTAMRGFERAAQGPAELAPHQIMDVIAYLRDRGAAGAGARQHGAGDASRGAELYAGTCAACHGVDGEGASGPQLNNPGFLSAASDGFLAATIVLGRRGTAMRSMVHKGAGIGQIDAEQVRDITAFLRGWEDPEPWRAARPVAEMNARSLNAGKALFATHCAGCHGPRGGGRAEGEGYHAPSLNSPEFLAAASDGFLQATIARGRRGTPMRPFGIGAGGIGALDDEQIGDIVSFIRSWGRPASKSEESGIEHGEEEDLPAHH